jgi:hypothetical protein
MKNIPSRVIFLLCITGVILITVTACVSSDLKHTNCVHNHSATQTVFRDPLILKEGAVEELSVSQALHRSRLYASRLTGNCAHLDCLQNYQDFTTALRDAQSVQVTTANIPTIIAHLSDASNALPLLAECGTQARAPAYQNHLHSTYYLTTAITQLSETLQQGTKS